MSTPSFTNPFATEEAWDVSTSTILGPGVHIVTLDEINETKSQAGNPQLEVKMSNGDGTSRDWISVMSNTVGKFVAVVRAAGVQPPNDDQVKAEGRGYRFHPDYLKTLIGKKVAIVVRQEPDLNDPSKMRDRVQGYKPPSEVKPQQQASQPAWGAATAPAQAGGVSEDDIPF